MNAGTVGPSFIFFITKCRSVSSMQTAFCSYHDNIIESGSSFTPHLNASASADATLIALYASLHCPISISLGSPPILPMSRSLNRYFPQASVRTTVSKYRRRNSLVRHTRPTALARPTRAQVSSSCRFASTAFYPHTPAFPVPPLQPAVCSH